MKFGRVGFGEAVDLDAQQVREARVKAARSNPNWVELEAALVRRPPAYHVDSDSDLVYQEFNAAVFEAGTGGIAFNATVPLVFVVADTGNVQFFQRRPGTWSEITRKRHKVPA